MKQGDEGKCLWVCKLPVVLDQRRGCPGCHSSGNERLAVVACSVTCSKVNGKFSRVPGVAAMVGIVDVDVDTGIVIKKLIQIRNE